jgi:ankyrin repeat protein
LLLRPEPQRGNYLSTNLPVEVVVPSGCDDGRRRPSQKEPVDLDADAHGSKSLQQVDRRKYACTKLFYAIRQEKTSEALELIRQCVEMDEREISMSNKVSISGAGLLMNHSSFDIPVGKGVTPLIMASQRGNVMVVKALLGHKTCLVHVNHFSSTGSTALIQASHFGHLEIVKYLLLHGANVEQANYKSTTALMRAAQEGHEVSKPSSVV